MLTYQVHLDTDRDGFFNAGVSRNDALNLLASPLAWSGIATRALNSATVAFVDAETDYGQRAFRITSGTHVNGGGAFGYSIDVGATIPINAATAYSTAVWLRGVSAYTGISVVVLCFDQAFNVFGVQVVTLTGDWQRVAFSFTSGAGSTHFYWHMEKSNSATAAVWDATGFMLVAGSVAPNGFNIGGATNWQDDLTRYVAGRPGEPALTWNYGLAGAYEEVAPPARCTLALINDDGAFNPENADSDYYGKLKIGTNVRVRVSDGTTTYTRWIGKIASVQVDVGVATAPRMAHLACADQWDELNRAELKPTLRENATVTTSLQDVWADAAMWPYESSYWLLGVSGCSELGVTTTLAGATNLDFETGVSTFSYIGDNLQREQDISARAFVRQLVQAELGRLWWDAPTATWKFTNRAYDTLNLTVAQSFTGADLTMVDYAAQDMSYNRLTLWYEPREVGAAGTVVWSLPNAPVSIAPTQTRVYNGRYTDPDNPDARIGAKDGIPISRVTDMVVRQTADPASAIVKWVMRVGAAFGADGVRITVRNSTPRTTLYIHQLTARATPLYAYQRQNVTAVNGDGVRDSVPVSYSLSVPILDDVDDAQAYADFLVNRFGTPTDRLRAVRLRLDDDTTALTAKALSVTVGTRVRMTLDDLDHDAEYIVVGEQATVDAGARTVDVMWMLEPASVTSYWALGVAGYSELGVTTRLFL